ncbi:DUF6268 family outer membrane beta-barrel protein [Flavobacterium sp.]|uniref:DUF6268 family outer membrane beta-barrel protein n=1 Tax=Flavobacterium sp. TaxID=239 RepID=UPI002CB7E758|nr:DUF6268 family outer membrane beta-barrel protein [Flavobacterium sp.]HSD08496.1 DUF6268 family outer membrane beta-barrel protein [Flavobacterium sp.]
MRIHNFTKILILAPLFSAYAQSSYTLEFNTKTEPVNYGSIKQTEIGLQFFKEINTKNKLTNTFKYKSTTITDEIENYLLENYDSNYSNTHFNSIANSFEFSHRFNDKTKVNMCIEPSVNFQNTISISDVTILGGMELNQILNKNNSIDLGIKRMTVFGKPQIVPTFAFNHQFNEVAYLKLGFPNSEVSYSSSIRDKFSISNDFIGSIYNLNPPIIADDLSTITKVGFSQMESTFQYERNIDTNWLVNFKGGYSSNKEFKFSNDNRTSEINKTLKNGSIFSISIKYKL